MFCVWKGIKLHNNKYMTITFANVLKIDEPQKSHEWRTNLMKTEKPACNWIKCVVCVCVCLFMVNVKLRKPLGNNLKYFIDTVAYSLIDLIKDIDNCKTWWSCCDTTGATTDRSLAFNAAQHTSFKIRTTNSNL